MKKANTRIALLTLLVLVATLPGAALATTYDGVVVSSETVGVTAPFGGVVNTFTLRQGDQLQEGDVIATVQTTKVYAPADGVITGLFGQVGDTVSDVVSRRGAVLYIEPTRKFSITADIQKAYNSSDNKYVNIGETVYIRSYSSDNDNEAVGIITAVDGTTYTVETVSGELLMSETVSIYRDENYATKSRIGRGTVSRTSAVSVGADDSASGSSSASGSGSSSGSSSQSILALHVSNGDTVTRGQLLYETIAGPLDGLYATGSEILADVSGIIASVNVSAGSSVSKGDTLLTVYPNDRMQVEVELDEYDLTDVKEGDQMTLTFNYADENDAPQVGTVESISHVSTTTDTSDVAYYAYLSFTPNDNIRLGMTVSAVTINASDAASDTTAADELETPAQDTTEALGD